MSELNTQLDYENMLRAGMHFGRKKTVFNPKMKKYVFTVKEGICIIDLIKTQEELTNVSTYLKKVVAANGLILFVALTKQSTDSVKELADALGMPYVVDRWLGGTLTNSKVITGRVKTMEEMERKQAANELGKYTKKERLLFDRELKKMKVRFGGIRKLSRMPDVVFVSSLKESLLPIREAKRMKIPVVAIANTDANPEEVDHVVPANDRSKKSVDMIIQAIKSELISNSN